MDQELYAYLEESRRLTRDQIESIRTQLEGRLDRLEGRIEQQGEGLHEEIRHTRVLLESARDEIRLLGEGMMGLTETNAIFRGEIRGQLTQIQALITPIYHNLRERLETLEARAERQTRDVLEVIRERYGTPQAR